MRNVCIILLISLLLCACAGKKTQMTIVTEEYPPLSFTENDSVKGYGTEIVNLMLEKMSETNSIQVMKWSEAYQLALSKPNIVIFTIEKTKEREDLFYWIGPIGSNETSIYVKKNNNIRIKDFDELKNIASIATTTDWFTEQYLLQKGFKNLTSMPNPEDNIKMVMKEKSTATVLTNVTYAYIVQKAGYQTKDLKPVYHIMSSDFYVGISKKTDRKIISRWQKAFDQLKQEGIVDSLQLKWKLR